MISVTSLLLLFFYIYSVLGVQLFYGIKINFPLDQQVNFQTVGRSMLTLMRVSTGENWQQVMHAVSRSHSLLYQCDDAFDPRSSPEAFEEFLANGSEPNSCGSGVIAVTFFVFFQLLIVLLFLNLFVAIILQGYIENQQKDRTIISLETKDLFRDIWSRYDPYARGTIHTRHFRKFMRQLGERDPQLGWSQGVHKSLLLRARRMKQLDLVQQVKENG